jgi:hypothetical protein
MVFVLNTSFYLIMQTLKLIKNNKFSMKFNKLIYKSKILLTWIIFNIQTKKLILN